MDFELSQLNAKEAYSLLTSCIVPRPIAWVTTLDENGIFNAAPFSYFTGVSIEPPLTLFAVERRQGEKKDTVINIERTKEFVVNLVTSSNVEQMNITSKDFQVDQDELKLAGLTPVRSKVVSPPSIKESPIHMECKLDQIIEIGSSPHSLVIGEVIQVTVDDDLVEEGKIKMEHLHAVGRMGGKWYTKTEQLFELPRLDWRKADIK
ncbi:flavin reductase family protein [Alkalihalobacillus sp. BA299]|uniref:flavin reductase family protein n=1 Tax=Alkalihalobacillus sp. BA299 TaxID=2815938 RepID=UPI001ADA0755|nr:flavin reductase family protein [Alkalihalobacillus sp. BA299]